MKKSYSTPFTVFMLIVVCFLLVQNIGIIANQRALLLESTEIHTQRQLEMMGAAALEALLTRDYVSVGNILQQAGKDNDEVAKLTAVSANGFILAEYKKDISHSNVLKTEHMVTYEGKELITLIRISDLSAINHKVYVLGLRLGLASTFFMLFMGLTLWHSMKKMAITPLEKEIILRRQAEEEKQKALVEVKEKNREIDSNRLKLKTALAEISALIEKVVNEKTFSVRFYNPNLRNCYEVVSCPDQECPLYGAKERRCWLEQAPFTILGKGECYCAAQSGKECGQCQVYLEATSDPMYQIGEQFNNMMHILENKNRELEDAYSELKATQSQMLQGEKMASIGQLAAGVAHEINNPIGFISSNLSSLKKYMTKFMEYIEASTTNLQPEELQQLRKELKIDFLAEDVQDLIRESQEGIDRVSEIVQNLKSFSRVDDVTCKEADINECLENTIKVIWNELKYKAKIIKEYGELPPVKCYPQQLNQVFMNFLINAAHAIEKEGEIKIKTWQDGTDICISIADTGHGIPAENITKLFEPFFTTKEVGKGTGLGLSIAHEIVQKHKGRIDVESEVGRGTTFTVIIPVSATA